MDIDEEYRKLKASVSEKIPSSYTFNNSLIEERPYISYNIAPGFYCKTYCEYTPRTYVGEPPVYRMTSGEETTMYIWNDILKTEMYDLLADLFILGFIHDCLIEEKDRWSRRSIAGCFYDIKTMETMVKKAKKIFEEKYYWCHDPRCKTYLTITNSEIYDELSFAARKGELKIKSTEELAEIMMDIIMESYDTKYFIINIPSDHEDHRYENDTLF